MMGLALLGLIGLMAACGSNSGGGSGTHNVQMGGAIQGTALHLTGEVDTLAGTAPGTDGTGAVARFGSSGSVVSDGTNVYVLDNNAIRKIVMATGVVTTLAGSGAQGAADGVGMAATFHYPGGITTDGTNLYVADFFNNKIRKIVIATGAVSSLTGVGNAVGAIGAADGSATSATFCQPRGITSDGSNLYVTDSCNYKVRKIVIATGAVSSLTGVANTAGAMGAADGAAVAATFNYSNGITTDNTYLYVADNANHKIRKIVIATGAVSSMTGVANTAGIIGAADGTATAATFNYPIGITTDNTYLYVTDHGNQKLRKIVIATGAVSSLTGVANTAGAMGAADGTATAATFKSPIGIAISGGNLYVGDSGNQTIRMVALSTATVSTLAGTAPGTDGTGAAASFNASSVTTDGKSLYVADRGNNKIRKVVIATGVVSTLAGSPTNLAGAVDGPGAAATFNSPHGITTDGSNLYVADTGNHKIRQIVIATGAVSSLTGAWSTASTGGAVDGPGAAATFYSPFGITTDGTNLYVADTGNNKVRQIVIATGAVSSLTGAWSTTSAGGAVDGTSAAATFSNPFGITTDGSNLYVADTANDKIRQIVIATGAVSSLTAVANTAGTAGAADGAATAATFSNPYGITTDGTHLYVADTSNNKIRQIVIASGVVSSLTGATDTAGTVGAADGTTTAATFSGPQGITSDGTSLYVTDASNNTIRRIK